MIRTWFVCICLLWATPLVRAQCIVINELMINGPGANDGQNAPNTEEWIELYNTCDIPVDIGCYFLTDGDFGVTIPSGTMMAPGSYFTIGSINAGFPVDLDVANCGCAGGTNIGVLTNGAEQLALFDASYNLVDGLIWGSGQMPINFFQLSYAGCTGHNYAFSDETQLETLPTGGGQGCVLHRFCDGSDQWLEDCSGGTPATTNGGQAEFAVQTPATPICTGDCIDWSLIDDTGIVSIDWQLEGAMPNNANTNTITACYDNPGFYDVQVTIESTCGAQILTLTNIVEVVELTATIEATSLQSSCPGESPILSTTDIGTYQWYLNNIPIAGATLSSMEANASGDYLVQIQNGSCDAVSNALSIIYLPLPIPSITLNGDQVLCPGDSLQLIAEAGYTDFQWYQDGNPISTADNYITHSGGLFQYTVEIGGCIIFSEETNISQEITLNPILSATTLNPCPNEVVVLELSETGSSIEWMRNNTVFQTTSSPQITVTQGGVFMAEITTMGGCVFASNSIEMIYIDLAPPGIASNDADYSICQDSVIVLTASGEYTTYEWWQTNNLVGVGTSYQANQAGTYSVIGYSNDCSVSSEAVTITLLPTPLLDVDANGLVQTCAPAYEVNLVTSGNLLWTYEGQPWTTTLPALLTEAGNYTITAQSNAGCYSNTTSFDLQFIAPAPIAITLNDSTACEGEEILLTASGPYQIWTWSDTYNGQSHTVFETGTYSVTGNSSDGCTQEASITLQFQSLPDLELSAQYQSDCVTGAVLEATSNGTVHWFDASGNALIEGLTCPVNPLTDAVYEAISELQGCTQQAYTTVFVDCDVLYIPSAITPNGDGLNDVFQIILNGFSIYHLVIFDRWGTPVFISNDPQDVWTGGVDTHYVPDGIYHYRLEVLDSQGNAINGRSIHEGHVTVLR